MVEREDHDTEESHGDVEGSSLVKVQPVLGDGSEKAVYDCHQENLNGVTKGVI
jgi:hypothetical protein